MSSVKREKRYVYSYNRTSVICSVYGYDFDTIPEMVSDGWVLCGTYYECLTFRKDI